MNVSANPQDYVFSGGVESSLIYFAIPSQYAARSIATDGLALTERGLTKFYINKESAQREKDTWVSLSRDEVTKAFETWKKKWSKADDELYQLVDIPKGNWLATWKHVNEMSKELWTDSYKIETPDSFADELEELVITGLQQSNISKELLYEIISPSTPTLPQQMTLDALLVENGQLSTKDYVRRYWYTQGTWNGGELLREEAVKEGITSKEAVHLQESLRARQQLHQATDPKLNSKTQNLVHLLRTLTLWREERKILLQSMNIILSSVVKAAAREMNIPELSVKWSRLEELDELKNNPSKFAQRFEGSALVNNFKDFTSEVIVGPEAKSFIQKFKISNNDQEVRGMVASSGKAKGAVRVILREHAFKRFQDGDILVTTMTRPEFVPLMKRAAAIITDEGGLTCHAAIVSRELGLPCIVGTKNSTEVLHDGDMVEVNANHGIVKILEQEI